MSANDVHTFDVCPSGVERAAGITEMVGITCKRLTIVVAESDDGYICSGVHASWPNEPHCPQRGLDAARRHAADRIVRVRGKDRDYHARGVPA